MAFSRDMRNLMALSARGLRSARPFKGQGGQADGSAHLLAASPVVVDRSHIVPGTAAVIINQDLVPVDDRRKRIDLLGVKVSLEPPGGIKGSRKSRR